jgi:hypothetical protein
MKDSDNFDFIKEEVIWHNFYFVSNETLGPFAEMGHLGPGLDQTLLYHLTTAQCHLEPYQG